MIKNVLVAVVSAGWLSAFFLPLDSNVQIGAQAAMMIVLGSIFGLKAGKNGE